LLKHISFQKITETKQECRNTGFTCLGSLGKATTKWNFFIGCCGTKLTRHRYQREVDFSSMSKKITETKQEREWLAKTRLAAQQGRQAR
jgi:hypothetical protein